MGGKYGSEEVFERNVMTDPLNYGTVDRVEPNGPTKVVYVSSIDPIVVSRYSPVSEGDELFGRDGLSQAW